MMKVLWISNVLFPDACKFLNISVPVVGGWMYSSARALLNLNTQIELGVVSFYPGSELKELKDNGIIYFLVPASKNQHRYNKKQETYFKLINRRFFPDVVHIHGSEYPHSLAWVKACNNSNVVVSIQGLVSVYARYYFGGIKETQLVKNQTIRDFIRWDSLFHQQREMENRGVFEIELLRSVKHVIGRTRWDKSNVWAINPRANYHFCNETLRPSFYNESWKYETCEKHSIFLSQAHYPIKGLQSVLNALPLIINEFPDVKLYISGQSLIVNNKLLRSGYVKFIGSIIRKLHLKDYIIFKGALSEQEMVKQFQKAHVFVCPSSIENSPNSVGEAQLVGTPCVASYVGGVMDMIEDEETGFLYRFEEEVLLALRVCELFRNKELCVGFSKKAKEVAMQRHSIETNALKLYGIYQKVMHSDN